jgi:hypothetical protein
MQLGSLPAHPQHVSFVVLALLGAVVVCIHSMYVAYSEYELVATAVRMIHDTVYSIRDLHDARAAAAAPSPEGFTFTFNCWASCWALAGHGPDNWWLSIDGSQ